MTDFSTLVDATLIFLGVAAVLFMGRTMASDGVAGLTASANSASEVTSPSARYAGQRQAA